MSAAAFTWAYRDSVTLSFNHWDDAAHRCSPIFAAITCQPIAYTSKECSNMLVNQTYVKHKNEKQRLDLPDIGYHEHWTVWLHKETLPMI